MICGQITWLHTSILIFNLPSTVVQLHCFNKQVVLHLCKALADLSLYT